MQDVFFQMLIPIFLIVFVVSTIFYVQSEKQRIAAGGEEFPNVLFLGGESGLFLKGIGGTYHDVRIPLEGKIVFGRDASRCHVIYPDQEGGISRVHCCVENKNGQIILTDMGSSYGTFLEDGTRISSDMPCLLYYSDGFYLSSPKNTFRVV